jgi:nicotinic acid mononucleotide adenylyltransferase/nicotinamide mononucleotide (NMN) deamidase PncC
MHPAIELLKEKNKKVVLAITGGGTEAIVALLEQGGASSVILDAQVPYACEALTKYLGRSPDKYCSKETACTMAATAWYNATKLGASMNDAVGVGVCCSLIREGIESPELYPDGNKRRHCAYIAIHTKEETQTYEVKLNELGIDRKIQEQKIGSCIVSTLELLCEEQRNPFWYLDDTDMVDGDKYSLKNIVNENARIPDQGLFGFKIGGEPSKIVFPGSFNPFHDGHKAICEHVYKKYGEKICFEISLTNFDKPPVDYFSLYQRIASLPKDEEFFGGICVTNTPLFDDKIKVFPNHSFVVGADTWNRILTANSSIVESDELKLIVVPRHGVEVLDWLPFNNINVHSFSLEQDFVGLDISSSQIRNK